MNNIFVGVIRTYYDKEETKLRQEYFVNAGKKEEEYVEYHENGNIKIISTYIDDKNNGINREYHEMVIWHEHI
jgi:antitoxin component YwqK of YwqJK toxin-antitoxin module